MEFKDFREIVSMHLERGVWPSARRGGQRPHQNHCPRRLSSESHQDDSSKGAGWEAVPSTPPTSSLEEIEKVIVTPNTKLGNEKTRLVARPVTKVTIWFEIFPAHQRSMLTC